MVWEVVAGGGDRAGAKRGMKPCDDFKTTDTGGKVWKIEFPTSG